MKRLLALLSAFTLLLTALTPALAETPAPLTLAAWLAAADAHAADYGYTLTWQQQPYQNEMTMTICDQLGGKPVLVSAPDGTLVALTTGATYDPGHPELFNEEFIAAMLFAFAPILRAEGMDRDAVNSALADFCNANGFLPGVVRVMETGETMNFTFRGYACRIDLLDVGGTTTLSLLVTFSEVGSPSEPALTPARDVPETSFPLTADFIATMNSLAADYGGSLEWSEVPLPDGLTGHVCTTLDSNPAIASAPDGTLVAINNAVPIDSEQLQASFDSFIGAMMTTMLPFFYMDGADSTRAMELLAPIFNADGFIPAIIQVMTRGGMTEFAFMGYQTRIFRTEVDGTPLICMLMVLQPELYGAE